MGILLKDKKVITNTNLVQKILDKYGRKPNIYIYIYIYIYMYIYIYIYIYGQIKVVNIQL